MKYIIPISVIVMLLIYAGYKILWDLLTRMG